jgi:ketosteroid isomerase-like protein
VSPGEGKPTDTTLVARLYGNFNTRDLEAALSVMHPDVIWANGMEGGHVHGRDGVRNYWIRQWATIDTRAEPVRMFTDEGGAIHVEVRLTARDRAGNVVFDEIGVHVFRVENGLVTRFDIRPSAG